MGSNAARIAKGMIGDLPFLGIPIGSIPNIRVVGLEAIGRVLDGISNLSRPSAEQKAKADKVKKALSPIPDELSQPTCQEVRNASIAIADGAMLRRWHEIPGEVALRHVIEDEPLQVKFAIGQWSIWTGSSASYEILKDELRTLNPEGTFLYLMVIGLSLRNQHVTLRLDDLIRLIGWQPRSTKEREAMRGQIYRWLTIFDALAVIGKRRRDYFDPITKKPLDLTCVEALVRISGIDYEEDEACIGGKPPVFVTLTAGPFLDKFRDNRRVLQDFGNVRKLAGLPTGQASGAWALSIGLALNQYWRQRAARAQRENAGDDNHLTVRFMGSFTRYRLLDMFRPEPWVEEVLKSSNPKRAQNYWKEAIRLLKQHQVIGHYAEINKMPNGRRGWRDFWLNYQQLDIRPKGDDAKDIAEISRSAHRAVKRASAQKRGAGSTKKTASLG